MERPDTRLEGPVLVRCARGAILDVVVDLRRGSPAFGEWEAFRLVQPAPRRSRRSVAARDRACVA